VVASNHFIPVLVQIGVSVSAPDCILAAWDSVGMSAAKSIEMAVNHTQKDLVLLFFTVLKS